jgi:hypothetical protein
MRFVEFGQLAFNQIAVFPGLTAPKNYYQSSLQLFALGDDACVLFVPPQNSNAPLNVYVVDSSGDYTWYATVANLWAQGFIDTILPLGPGLFFVAMGNSNLTFFVRVANHKLNNATPILLKPSLLPLTNPCYAANPKIFYDAAKNLLSVGFYAGGGGGAPTSVWTSMYRPSSSELTSLTTGFVGSSEGDPFASAQSIENITGTALTGTCSNGLSYILNPATVAPYAGLALTYVAYDVNQGIQSGCDVPCGASVGTYSSGSVDVNIEGPIFSYNNSTGADCNIPGIVGAVTYYNPGSGVLNYIFYTDGLSAFQCEFANSVDNFRIYNAALTKKYLFVSTEAENPNSRTAIVIAPNPGIVRTPTAVVQSAFVLVNSARPISLTGAYKS